MNRRLVLFGPPAAGKGTQAALIEEHYGIPTVSTGAVLRAEKASGTELGREASQYSEQGRLFPDVIALRLVEKWLNENGDAFVLDGFPRSLPQAEGLDEILSRLNLVLDAVIFLDVDDGTIRRRIVNRLVCEACDRIVSIGVHVQDVNSPCPACGGRLLHRSDDTLETLEQRLVEYREKTKPLIHYYQERRLLVSVGTGDTPEVVFQEVSRIVEGL